MSVLATALNKTDDAELFRTQALTTPWTIFNNDTRFMQARLSNGSWSSETAGWTEGDKWAYTFDVVHDMPGLIERRGGGISRLLTSWTSTSTEVSCLLRIADVLARQDVVVGHNDHTNEVIMTTIRCGEEREADTLRSPRTIFRTSARWQAQHQSRKSESARSQRTATTTPSTVFPAYESFGSRLAAPLTDTGVQNEDCGQMSAWFIFSALGFYPVNPVSAEYVVGT